MGNSIKTKDTLATEFMLASNPRRVTKVTTTIHIPCGRPEYDQKYPFV
jgi:hypothetical protein